MKKDKIEKTMVKLSAMWQIAASATFLVNNTEVEFTNAKYKRKATFKSKVMIKSEFTLIEPSLLQSLSSGEQNLVIKIIAEMKKNNALWYFAYRNTGRMERAVLSLRRKEVLFKTDNTNFHIVNPWLLRRGNIESVIVSTHKIVEKSVQLDRHMIKDLKQPEDADINGFYSLMT